MDSKTVPFSSTSPPVFLEIYVPSVMSEPKMQTFLLKSPHFQGCWQKNLGLEAVNWKTVVKVGMAPPRLPCQQMHNISPRCCLNPLQFIIFNSETANEPAVQLLSRTAKSQPREVKHLLDTW
jgi:hypothetical protein